MFAEEDQFWEYSKTSFRICGTKAACPFECFEESCALNIGFVTGANLEAMSEVFTWSVGRKEAAGLSLQMRCAVSGQGHSTADKSRLAHTDAYLFISITAPSFSSTRIIYPLLNEWPAQHVHKNSQTTHQMVTLLNLIPYPLRPNHRSHPQGNANAHPWLPQRISLLQSNLEMAMTQKRTLAKRRCRRLRILQNVPRVLVTSHLTLPPHNKFLIFLRCLSRFLFTSYRSHPCGAGLILRVFLIGSFRSLLIPPALQLPLTHDHPSNHRVTLSVLF